MHGSSASLIYKRPCGGQRDGHRVPTLHSGQARAHPSSDGARLVGHLIGGQGHEEESGAGQPHESRRSHGRCCPAKAL